MKKENARKQLKSMPDKTTKSRILAGGEHKPF